MSIDLNPIPDKKDDQLLTARRPNSPERLITAEIVDTETGLFGHKDDEEVGPMKLNINFKGM